MLEMYAPDPVDAVLISVPELSVMLNVKPLTLDT